jgi:Uncharacterised protein family (UPF0158)
MNPKRLGSATQVMLLRKPHAKTVLIFNGLRRQSLPSSITCVALPEDFPEWQHDAIRIAGEILETEHYLPLPDRFEINEYRMMERFCLSVDDEDMRDDLCDAIRGRGAFRRFKDRMQLYGLADDWYRYRDEALREIAVAWCEAHDIPYTE